MTDEARHQHAPSAKAAREHAPLQNLDYRLVPWLEGLDHLIYLLVGVVFLVAALGMLAYSVVAFPGNLQRDGFPLAVIALVNDLLLVMIIMEVLRTVLSYLEARGSSLQPFLFIAAISATRRILAIGAQMSVAGETLSPAAFERAMIDLVANAGAILVIAFALFLLGRRRQSGAPTGGETRAGEETFES